MASDLSTPSPPGVARTWADSLLSEPLWIGGIILLSILVFLGLVMCIRRRCEKREKRAAEMPSRQPRLSLPSMETAHTPVVKGRINRIFSFGRRGDRTPAASSLPRPPDIRVTEAAEEPVPASPPPLPNGGSRFLDPHEITIERPRSPSCPTPPPPSPPRDFKRCLSERLRSPPSASGSAGASRRWRSLNGLPTSLKRRHGARVAPQSSQHPPGCPSRRLDFARNRSLTLRVDSEAEAEAEAARRPREEVSVTSEPPRPKRRHHRARRHRHRHRRGPPDGADMVAAPCSLWRHAESAQSLQLSAEAPPSLCGSASLCGRCGGAMTLPEQRSVVSSSSCSSFVTISHYPRPCGRLQLHPCRLPPLRSHWSFAALPPDLSFDSSSASASRKERRHRGGRHRRDRPRFQRPCASLEEVEEGKPERRRRGEEDRGEGREQPTEGSSANVLLWMKDNPLVSESAQPLPRSNSLERITPASRRARFTKSYSDDAGSAVLALRRESCGDQSFDLSALSAELNGQRFLKVPSGLPTGRDFDPVPARAATDKDGIAMPTFAADTFIYVEDWSNRSFDAHSVMTLREFRKKQSVEPRNFDTKSDSLLYSSSSEGEVEMHLGRMRPLLSDSAYETKENSTESRVTAGKTKKTGEESRKTSDISSRLVLAAHQLQSHLDNGEWSCVDSVRQTNGFQIMSRLSEDPESDDSFAAVGSPDPQRKWRGAKVLLCLRPMREGGEEEMSVTV